jgi:hypothetical protein
MVDRRPRLRLIGAGSQSRNLVVHYKIAGESADVAVPRLGSACMTLAAAGAGGAFPASAISRHESSLVLTSEERLGSDVVVHRLGAINIDVRAFQCLRNIVRALRREQIFVVQLDVVDVDESGGQTMDLDWPTDRNDSVAYPGMSPGLESVLEREESDFSKLRRCLIEVRESLDADAVDRFEQSVQPWYRLVEAGGFSTPIGLPEDVESIAGSVSQFDEQTIEVTLTRFLGSEQAWMALANMADRFWRFPDHLRRIVVD